MVVSEKRKATLFAHLFRHVLSGAGCGGGVYPSWTPGSVRWIANRMAKTRRAAALESERSARRWLGQPGNRVDGPIADFWLSAVVSGANQLLD
jgi:hypothetical protein